MSLQEQYKTKAVPKLKEEFGFTNVHAVPQIQKVVINVGIGKGLQDARYLDTAEKTVRRITGQQPIKTLARKSISTFKIRQGNVVGLKVTLRGKRMWNFLEKLINVALPRTRDFRGLSPNSFDKQGAYSIGFKEHIAFPEIGSDELEVVHGLQVTIVTTAHEPKHARALLKHLGLPIKEKA